MAMISSFIIAFVFFPLYKKIHKKIKSEKWSSFIVSSLIILIMIVPSVFVLDIVTKEVTNIYSEISIKLSEDKKLLDIECKKNSTICASIDNLNDNPRFRFYVSGAITNLASTITRNTSTFLFSVPKKVIDIIIMFFLISFLFRNGQMLGNKTVNMLPFKDSHKAKLIKRFKDTITGVVYGMLLIALLEALVGWAAFLLIGNSIALILALLIGILAFIPMIGASVVWVPAAIIYFFSGQPLKTFILSIAGFILMVLDTWIRAKFIGHRTNVHPVIIALGVLGGIITFGIIGIVIGPVILSLFITAVEIYQEEKKDLLDFS